MSVSPVSVSVAVTTAPTLPAVETAASPTVSVKLRDVVSVANTGALLVVAVLVRPAPGGSDQAESPSSLVARTCTSYSVFAARPVTVAVVSVTSRGPSIQVPEPLARYCTS